MPSRARPAGPGVRVACFAAFTLLAAASGRRAFGHHVVSEHGFAPVVPRSVAGVDVAAASFELEGRRGHWETVTPSLEWGFARRVSLFLALPLARLDHDRAAQAVVGVGDLSVSMKANLYATPHGGLLISAGLGVEVPTGRSEDGLGAGHFEVTPFAMVASSVWSAGGLELIVHTLASARLALEGHTHSHGGGGSAHLHGSLLAPHAGRELFARGGVALVGRRAYLAAGAEGAAPLGSGEGYLAPRVEAGMLLTTELRAFVGVDGVALGQRRHLLRGRAGVGWLF